MREQIVGSSGSASHLPRARRWSSARRRSQSTCLYVRRGVVCQAWGGGQRGVQMLCCTVHEAGMIKRLTCRSDGEQRRAGRGLVRGGGRWGGQVRRALRVVGLGPGGMYRCWAIHAPRQLLAQFIASTQRVDTYQSNSGAGPTAPGTQMALAHRPAQSSALSHRHTQI